MGCLSEYVWSDTVMGSLIPQVIGPFIACDSTPAASHAAERHGVRTEEREKERGGSVWELVGEAVKKMNLSSRFASI